MTIFEARDIVYRYDAHGDQFALHGVSMAVREGERIALLGANGSGKSTLLRLLDGLCFPESGELLFRGEVLTSGGRVLCVTSFAGTVYEAVDKSRDVLEKVDYEGIYYRRDIGYEFL